eukprot:7326231-Lingulodinium_polyedra.AAC.1
MAGLTNSTWSMNAWAGRHGAAKSSCRLASLYSTTELWRTIPESKPSASNSASTACSGAPTPENAVDISKPPESRWRSCSMSSCPPSRCNCHCAHPAKSDKDRTVPSSAKVMRWLDMNCLEPCG